MSGAVVCLPGIDPASVRPLPTSLADLRPGDRALVIKRDGVTFTVNIWPPLTGEHAGKRVEFSSLRKALQFARRSRACWPRSFQLVVNQTGRRSLSDLLDNDPDPMGIWRRK